jgi:branched-chain amino acid aminotransferase
VSRGKRIVHVNGRLVAADEAAVSVFDHGFLYGDGVFETLVVADGRIFRLDEHLDRLQRSAAAIRLALPIRREALRAAVLDTVRENGLPDAYVRLVVSRGPGRPVLDPRGADRPTVVVMVHAREEVEGAGDAYRSDGVRARIVSVRKVPSACLEARVKSLNYLNHILARVEAVESGADEAILLDVYGLVAEGPGENVFAVSSGTLLTPPVANVLDGITRRAVIEVAAACSHETVERPLTPYDLRTADELFFTSTYAGVVAVAELDGHPIGTEHPGPVTRRLRERYERLVRETGLPVDVESEIQREE